MAYTSVYKNIMVVDGYCPCDDCGRMSGRGVRIILTPFGIAIFDDNDDSDDYDEGYYRRRRPKYRNSSDRSL